MPGMLRRRIKELAEIEKEKMIKGKVEINERYKNKKGKYVITDVMETKERMTKLVFPHCSLRAPVCGLCRRETTATGKTRHVRPSGREKRVRLCFGILKISQVPSNNTRAHALSHLKAIDLLDASGHAHIHTRALTNPDTHSEEPVTVPVRSAASGSGPTPPSVRAAVCAPW